MIHKILFELVNHSWWFFVGIAENLVAKVANNHGFR